LVLHCRPAVVRRLKTQTGTLSEVKPIIKWMHSMSRNCTNMDVIRKRKHARDCRQPRSHTLRRESHEERGSVNYEGPFVWSCNRAPEGAARTGVQPHTWPPGKTRGDQMLPEGTRWSVRRPSGWCAGLRDTCWVQGKWPRGAEGRPSCIKERAWATRRASCACMLSCRYVSWWCWGDKRVRSEEKSSDEVGAKALRR
jgi:hypothetical protein